MVVERKFKCRADKNDGDFIDEAKPHRKKGVKGKPQATWSLEEAETEFTFMHNHRIRGWKLDGSNTLTVKNLRLTTSAINSLKSVGVQPLSYKERYVSN
ncbi:hypothetical protein V6N11_083340 [Hibiscus sabdariffa]|uniref:Uncharacterized protein n=1 Tax=Hibiscus sabdariffa TaxID=183260 RepID=A0ABR2QLP0_9ROSI